MPQTGLVFLRIKIRIVLDLFRINFQKMYKFRSIEIVLQIDFRITQIGFEDRFRVGSEHGG